MSVNVDDVLFPSYLEVAKRKAKSVFWMPIWESLKQNHIDGEPNGISQAFRQGIP